MAAALVWPGLVWLSGKLVVVVVFGGDYATSMPSNVLCNSVRH